MRPWRWLEMAGAVTVAVVITGSMADAQQCPKGKLRLYASWTLQGVANPAAIGMKNGVDMAVAEAGGAVAGYCLEVVTLSNVSAETGRWDRSVEARNARAAVADPLAIVYIGPFDSGAAMISIPITNRAHMAQIGLSAHPGLTRKGTGAEEGEPWIYRPLALVNFFRLVLPTDAHGEAAARWAKRLGAKKVFVLHDGDRYGKSIAAAFEVGAKKIGLEVVADQGIDSKQPDQKAILGKVAASGADLVYMGGVSDSGAPAVIRQMREAGLVAPRVRFMGPGPLLTASVLKNATCDAAMATDMRVTLGGLPYVRLKGVGVLTYEDYTKRFGAEPPGFALYAVEAGRVAIDGIRRAAGELDRAKDVAARREAVRKAIAATKAFDGHIGTWSFDRNGDVDYDADELDRTISGFSVVKDDDPVGCRFEFETTLD